MTDAQLFEVEGDERRHGLPNLVTAEGALQEGGIEIQLIAE
jgi:hypothetical protein